VPYRAACIGPKGRTCRASADPFISADKRHHPFAVYARSTTGDKVCAQLRERPARPATGGRAAASTRTLARAFSITPKYPLRGSVVAPEATAPPNTSSPVIPGLFRFALVDAWTRCGEPGKMDNDYC